MHEPKKVYSCKICSKVFPDSTKRRNHQLTHEKKVKCHICCIEVKRYYLKLHLKNHKEVAEFQCDICSVSFKGKNSLAFHMNKHQKNRKFRCEICKQGFNKPEYFKEHLLSHSADPRPFKCDLCPREYCSRRAVIHHITQVHLSGSKKKVFNCKECNRSFTNSKYLKEHLFAHSNNPRPFKCDRCRNDYKSRRALIHHKKVVHNS